MQTHLDIQTNAPLGDRGLIDIYLPAGDGPHPFVLVVHGGGWRDGDRQAQQWVVGRLVPHGYAAVLCSYRVAREAAFPGAYDDLVYLLHWLREHGYEHRLDPDRAALLGGSAGGHLVTLLSTRATREQTNIINIRAVIAYCPVTDMRNQFEWDTPRGMTITVDFMGGKPDRLPDAYVACSPIDHIHAGVPPTFLAHGDQDDIVPVSPTLRYAEALEQAGVAVRLHIARGQPHIMIEDGEADPLKFLFESEALACLSEHLGA
jgi:acetyl esterase/lipase